MDKILKRVTAKFILVEIHAEATSEKLAMGHMLDGRVSAVGEPIPTSPQRITKFCQNPPVLSRILA